METEIPTASMADIAFLLIIFFMTTTIFARDKGLKLVLPEKGSEVKVKSEKIVKISINDMGQIFFGDEPISLSQVQPKLKERLEEDPKVVILLKTHIQAPYGTMLDVFDEIKAIPDTLRLALGTIRPGGG